MEAGNDVISRSYPWSARMEASSIIVLQIQFCMIICISRQTQACHTRKSSYAMEYIFFVINSERFTKHRVEHVVIYFDTALLCGGCHMRSVLPTSDCLCIGDLSPRTCCFYCILSHGKDRKLKPDS